MEEKEICSMNVIPFVDIMLVLLTIVLISATFIAVGKIPVNLPTGKGDPAHEVVKIYITEYGKIYINERPVTDRELKEELNKLNQNIQIFIGADRDVTMETLVYYLRVLRESGFSKISFGVKER